MRHEGEMSQLQTVPAIMFWYNQKNISAVYIHLSSIVFITKRWHICYTYGNGINLHNRENDRLLVCRQQNETHKVESSTITLK